MVYLFTLFTLNAMSKSETNGIMYVENSRFKNLNTGYSLTFAHERIQCTMKTQFNYILDLNISIMYWKIYTSE